MKQEIWKFVAGYEGIYSISDWGRVKRHATVVKNGNGPMRLPARDLKPISSGGYLLISLWKDNRGKMHRIHRLVARAFLGESDLSVDHINGERTDNRLENLRYCTLAANTRLQHKAGRMTFVRGEQNGKAKLTEDTVREARRLLASGIFPREVGAILGVSKGAIRELRAGRTWGHVA